MAEVKTATQSPSPVEAFPTPPSVNRKRGPSLDQIYSLPAPIRTFPLPTFYPNNPISLFHVVSAWLSQVLSPPPVEPAVIHRGVWSEATKSIHVTDDKSMRALWEQGFYGKGSLSRSEPNWLKREQVRRGLRRAHVSELATVQRRQERAQAKWERARLEQEAIRSVRLEEARQAEARGQAKLVKSPVPSAAAHVAPVGPMEILALPNSHVELSVISQIPRQGTGEPVVPQRPPIDRVTGVDTVRNNLANGGGTWLAKGTETYRSLQDGHLDAARPNGDGRNCTAPKCTESRDPSSDSAEGQSLKQHKSVSFSPEVESTTFQLSDPPSPNHCSTSGGVSEQLPGRHVSEPKSHGVSTKPSAAAANGGEPAHETGPIVNKEHLQLAPEEAFFLSFGLGALSVSDPVSGKSLSTRDMLTLFRQHSYLPPRVGPGGGEPDDGFLIHYAVYHHFRSLGWVPRAGIKFGVDWLLYTRGPVFDHAEFGLMVIPSYSDAWWKTSGKEAGRKTWHWLHSIVRVLSHVTKSLVLVYVDVPPPPIFDAALEAGVTEVLKLYKVREVMVKRWSSNRNR